MDYLPTTCTQRWTNKGDPSIEPDTSMSRVAVIAFHFLFNLIRQYLNKSLCPISLLFWKVLLNPPLSKSFNLMHSLSLPLSLFVPVSTRPSTLTSYLIPRFHPIVKKTQTTPQLYTTSLRDVMQTYNLQVIHVFFFFIDPSLSNPSHRSILYISSSIFIDPYLINPYFN